MPKLIRGGWPIECGIIPNRAKAGLTVVEVLAVLVQTLPSKSRLGVLLEVDLALPAFVCPDGGAEAHERGERYGKQVYEAKPGRSTDLVTDACAIIAVQNHPSGDPTPSPEDRTLTTRLREAGDLLGIRLLDHLILGDDRLYSFADQGWPL